MNVLGIDCSSDSLCVAVRRSSGTEKGADARRELPKHPFKEAQGHATREGVVIHEIDTGLRHAQLVLPAVEACLKDSSLSLSDLDLLACASGPGSFTGLRIAMATVKGLSSALAIPFVAVPTLDCLASDWTGASPVIIPVQDAQRGRFYAAVYEHGRRTSGYLDLPLADLLELVDTFSEVLIVGPDADLLLEAEEDHPGLRVARYGRRVPGRALVDLAEAQYRSEGPSPSDASPLYVRKSDAEENEHGTHTGADGSSGR
jgi:tRNA threonylcarbamoyladenosine biosynthesis protein TsaB